MGRFLSAPRWEKRPPRMLSSASINSIAMAQNQPVVMLELNTPGTLKKLIASRTQATGSASRCLLEIVIDGVVAFSVSLNMSNSGFTALIGADSDNGTKVSGLDNVAFNRLKIRCTPTDGSLGASALQLSPTYEVY